MKNHTFYIRPNLEYLLEAISLKSDRFLRDLSILDVQLSTSEDTSLPLTVSFYSQFIMPQVFRPMYLNVTFTLTRI